MCMEECIIACCAYCTCTVHPKVGIFLNRQSSDVLCPCLTLSSCSSAPVVIQLKELLKGMLTTNPKERGSWVAAAVWVAVQLPAMRPHISDLPFKEAVTRVFQPLLTTPLPDGKITANGSSRRYRTLLALMDLAYELNFKSPMSAICWYVSLIQAFDFCDSVGDKVQVSMQRI